jgi:hypothetical protein
MRVGWFEMKARAKRKIVVIAHMTIDARLEIASQFTDPGFFLGSP